MFTITVQLDIPQLDRLGDRLVASIDAAINALDELGAQQADISVALAEQLGNIATELGQVQQAIAAGQVLEEDVAALVSRIQGAAQSASGPGRPDSRQYRTD